MVFLCVYATSLLSICQRKESCIRVFRSFVVTLLHSLLLYSLCTDLEDFNNTVLTLTFQADENSSTPTNDIQLRVPIADDAINEATEQDFVVILNLTNSVNPSLTVLPRVSSLCRIIDNDRKLAIHF